MSAVTKMPMSLELKDAFNSAKASSAGARALVVGIAHEKLELLEEVGRGSSVENDFNALKEKLNDEDPRYILFRSDDGWWIVAYIPDTAKTQQKMVAAATKGALKNGLGAANFVDDLNLTTKSEFNYADVKKSRSIDENELLSPRERALKQLNQAAEVARSEQSSARGSGVGRSGGGSGATQSLAAALTSPRGGRSSGFHAVELKVDDAVAQAIKDVHGGSSTNNTLVLKITDDQSAFAVDTASRCDNDEALAALLKSTAEPRFVLYSWKHTRSGVSKTSFVFIYWSPMNQGTFKLRMVYSTAKAKFQERLDALNCAAARAIEWGEASDVAGADFLTNEVYPKAASYSAGARTGSKTKTPLAGSSKVQAPHALASLMGGSGSVALHRGGKKKIVMPPAAAWGQ